MARHSWDYITNTATNTDNMSRKNSVYFHYFNDNGIYAESKRQQDSIMELVKAGTIKSGWLIAYDDSFYYKQMIRFTKLTRINRTKYVVWLSMWRDHIEKVNCKLADVTNN